MTEAGRAPSLHHVGCVVDSIEAKIAEYQADLGAVSATPSYDDPIQRARVAFLELAQPGATRIELVEPLTPDSPVARFLADKGGGLHHLCYEVDDLEAHIARMKKQRAVLVRSPRPAVAFGGRRIAWMLTRGALLVEYLERKPDQLKKPSV